MFEKKIRFPATLAFALGAIALVGAGCASTNLQVHHAADPDLEPASYASYRVIERAVGESSADDAVSAAIHETMAKHGYQSEASGADLLVTYKLLTVDQGQQQALAGVAGGAVAGGIAGGDEVVGMDEIADRPVRKLVLIQLQDAKSMQIVWVGWAQAEVDKEQLANRATEAATKILQRMPRRPLS